MSIGFCCLARVTTRHRPVCLYRKWIDEAEIFLSVNAITIFHLNAVMWDFSTLRLYVRNGTSKNYVYFKRPCGQLQAIVKGHNDPIHQRRLVQHLKLPNGWRFRLLAGKVNYISFDCSSSAIRRVKCAFTQNKQWTHTVRTFTSHFCFRKSPTSLTFIVQVFYIIA
jgi:hypothetical protein